MIDESIAMAVITSEMKVFRHILEIEWTERRRNKWIIKKVRQKLSYLRH